MNKGGNDLSPIIYYYSHVQGWSLQNGQWDMDLVDRLIGKGADFFVGQYIMREDGLDDFVEQVRAKYKVLYENKEKQQIIISLK
jgi:5,10-methylenetetrahydrofolate reductase